MNTDPKLRKLTTTALMAAIIFVVTFLIRIPLPFASGGYLNIGDAPVYLAAFLLGGPAGAAAAAIGSALSDLIAGYVVYAIPTAIIKGAMGFVCGKLMYDSSGGDANGGKSGGGKGFRRFVIAAVIGGAIMVAGYAIFEAFFFNLNQALASIPFNAVQWAGGVIVAAALFPAVNKLRSVQQL
ncbi:MAG: ECF transporter S component [Clostridiales Family XIII bacterium]|jgi:uncharacterized membrane protein|nr:ECF transporter S component [Clostridiales Family XIII bacterium]